MVLSRAFIAISLYIFLAVPCGIIYYICKLTLGLSENITLIIVSLTTLILMWILVGFIIEHGDPRYPVEPFNPELKNTEPLMNPDLKQEDNDGNV